MEVRSLRELGDRLRENRNPFLHTLSLIQERLNGNLPEGYRRIWIAGLQKGSVKICITAFPTTGEYQILFHTIKNFRLVKNEMGDNVINEIISMYENTIRDILKT
jgi:hypothetical protein